MALNQIDAGYFSAIAASSNHLSSALHISGSFFAAMSATAHAESFSLGS